MPLVLKIKALNESTVIYKQDLEGSKIRFDQYLKVLADTARHWFKTKRK